MKSRNSGAIKLIIFVLLAAYLLTGPAAIAAPVGAGPSSLPYGWTLEKMKNAIPYPMEELSIPFRGEERAVPQAVGAPGWVPSRLPDGWTRPLITNNPAGTYPPPAPTPDNITDYVSDRDIVKFPHIATGKVYFVMQGRNYVCSASVIGENTVWTAGHCVSNGKGVFHDNWVFIPDFDNYIGPFVGYIAIYAATSTEFALTTDLTYDFAIVGVRSFHRNDKSIRRKVGAVGFAWNMPREQQWLQLGYPQLIFDGVRQVFSNGTYYRDNPRFTPPSVGVGSRMKSGCSGGPWLLNPMPGEAGEANYLNGVNSYISSVADELYSPYLDDRAKRLWDCAQNSTQDKLVCPDSKAATNLVLTNTAGSAPVQPGSQFSYTLKLENFGPADATNIVLTDHLPAQVSVVSFDLPGGACSLASPDQLISVITCTLDTLPSGASAIATVKVDALPARGSFTNMASVSFDQIGEWASAAGAVTDVCNGDITVTNTNDSGAGSLREAIDIVCPGGTIDFAPALSGAVIHLASQLELEPYGMTIDGSKLPERITISGDTDGDGIGNTRVFDVKSSVTLDSLIVTKGYAADGAGGIFNESGLTLKNCTLTESSSDGAGGGILNGRAAVLTVINSTLSGNSAPYGGGIYIDSAEATCRVCLQGMVRLKGSTLSGNSATTEGGGIYNLGRLNVSNSTLSKNLAINSAGGGIVNFGKLTLTNSTLSGSSAAKSYVGGIYNGGTLNYANTIIANSRGAGDCLNNGGTIGTNSHNLVEDGSCSDGGIQFKTGDPMLGPLADNGGSTRTLALLPGSPAIDAGDDAVCAAAPVKNRSQNSIPRPQGTHCDIGSFEAPETLTFQSVAAYDGWILESYEGSRVGGRIYSNGLLRVGDDSHNRQCRSIVHFNTMLPANAVITRAALRIRQSDVTGDPFTAHGHLIADIRKGSLGNSELESSDFELRATSGQKSSIGKFKALGDGWYQLVLAESIYEYINPAGSTQFRLRFALGEDNDGLDDYVRFFAGNAASANRPQLIIQHYLP